MGMWKYTIENGTALREAIYDGSTKEVVNILTMCCEELSDKLNNRDKEYCREDIQDILDTLYDIDVCDTETIDDCLADFYDICDSVRAFVNL